MRGERVVPLLKERREARLVAGRTVEEAVESRQPERGYLGAVDAAPVELGGHFVGWNAATKPERLVAGQLQQLRHLGMVPEGVEKPAHGDVHTQLFAAVALPILHLAHEQLAAGLYVVRHHVHAADDLQPALRDILPKAGGLFGIALQERLDIGHLVQRELEVGVPLEQRERLEDVRQAHVQVLFPRLENRTLPVRVRDVVERLGRSRAPRLRQYRSCYSEPGAQDEQRAADPQSHFVLNLLGFRPRIGQNVDYVVPASRYNQDVTLRRRGIACAGKPAPNKIAESYPVR